MSTNKNQERRTVENPADFWRRTYSAEKTQPFMRLQATSILAGMCERRLPELIASHKFPLPNNILEVGSGLDPFAKYLIGALLNNIATPQSETSQNSGVVARLKQALQTGVKKLPTHRILAADFPYNNPETRIQVADKIISWVKKIPPMSAGANHGLQIHENIPVQYQMSRTQQLEVTFTSQGAPEFQIPDDFGEYILTFISLLNYLDNEKIEWLFNDPRIRAIAFVNGAGLGTTQVPHAFERDAEAQAAILEYLESLGFMILDEVKTISDSEDLNRTEFKKAPIYGFLMVRPRNEAEKRFLESQEKQTRYLNTTNSQSESNPQYLEANLINFGREVNSQAK